MPATPPLESDPLAGVRVLDMVDAGCESTAKVLADLGADVIRIETPGGSRSRRSGPAVNGTGLGFATRNANKRGVTLDLNTSGDMQRFEKLLSGADILLDGSGPGVLAGQGLGPEHLRSLNPALTVVSITDFGQNGPWRDWKATSAVHSALSSFLSRSGLPSVPEPLLPPAYLAYEGAAAQAAWLTMLMFWSARRTGVGSHADFSVLDGVIQVLDPGFGMGGTARGTTSVKAAPRGRPDAGHLYPIFKARDGYVRLCVLSPKQWQSLCAWMGHPEALADPRYAQAALRHASFGAIFPVIAAMMESRTRAELVEQGQSFGVPTAGLLTIPEVLAEPAFRDAGSFTGLQLAPGLDIMAPDAMLEVNGRKAGIRRPAPKLGEHNDEVFSEQRPPRIGHPAARSCGLPFSGLKVLDLGVIVVGGELGRLFADYGAEVIKVESREFPDGTRQAYAGEDMSESCAWGHRNKKSLGLNLRSPEGLEIFLKLVEQADIVLSNFKPGTLQKLGLDYARLSRVNPRIILSESSAFGNHGPWSTRMGYGPLVRASSGTSMQWQYPGIEGSFSDAVTIYPDHVVARINAVGVVSLLVRRLATGRGGHIASAQIDVIFSAMATEIAAASVPEGHPAVTAHAQADEPSGIFPSSGDDEWVVVDVASDQDFAGLSCAIGQEGWLKNPLFTTASGRAANRDKIVPALAAWTGARPAKAAAAQLQRHGVPAGHMARVSDFLSDPYLLARGFIGTLPWPGGGELPAFTREAGIDNIAGPRLETAPVQGEHTRAVMREWAGLPHEEIERLIAGKVLEPAEPPRSARETGTPTEGKQHASASQL